MKNIIILLLGTLFGVVMFKAEAASWFRIYEMFKFESFHMYGFIGTALFIGVIGIQLIKRSKMKDLDGQEIHLPNKDKGIPKYLIGGAFFGMGWALIGACPGPMFVMLGTGLFTMGIAILGAILGTFLYGIMRSKLPH